MQLKTSWNLLFRCLLGLWLWMFSFVSTSSFTPTWTGTIRLRQPPAIFAKLLAPVSLAWKRKRIFLQLSEGDVVNDISKRYGQEIAPSVSSPSPHVANVLLVECGFGNDSHGQNATKAAIRACRNAIEFNSVSIRRIVPGGYDNMKVNVILAVPPEYMHTLHLDQLAPVFPFGDVRFEVRPGGMIAPSGRAIEQLGDRNDDMVMVCAAVQVGY